MLHVLVDELELAAASLWLYTDDQQPLRLRASVGLSMSAYESFELGLMHYPGLAISGDEVLEIHPHELDTAPQYRDKHILPPDARGGMVAGPIKVPDRAPDKRDLVGVAGAIGAVCLYPPGEDARADLRDWLIDNGDFLGRLYVAVIERHAIALRRSIVEGVAFRKDLASLEHNFLRLARNELAVQAAQLWIVDPTPRRLYLHRADGVGQRPVHDVAPLPYTDSGPVVRCFRSGETLVHTMAHPLPKSTELGAGLTDTLSNAMLAPLPLPPSAALRGEHLASAGVLVLLNNYAVVGKRRHLAVATWEDRFIAQFSCEMLAVLIFQMLKSRDHESDFERLMHGARRNLQAPLANLLALDAVPVDPLLPASYRNYISDAIFLLEDFAAQVSRNELIGSGHLDLKPINLFHDVLTKVAAMARRMPARRPAKRLVVQGLDDPEATKFARTLPRVKGNEAALTSVFRNLIDNSIKYTERTPGFVPELRVALALSEDGSTVVVELSDNGIGISNADRDLIFEDGYRGATARGHVPDGLGRGLYDCQWLLEQMHGSIAVLPPLANEKGARFQVRLQTTSNAVARR
jgi:hypothetical protein